MISPALELVYAVRMKGPSSVRLPALGVAARLGVLAVVASCQRPLPAEPASAVPGEQPASTLVEVGAPELTPEPDSGAPDSQVSTGEETQADGGADAVDAGPALLDAGPSGAPDAARGS